MPISAMRFDVSAEEWLHSLSTGFAPAPPHNGPGYAEQQQQESICLSAQREEAMEISRPVDDSASCSTSVPPTLERAPLAKAAHCAPGRQSLFSEATGARQPLFKLPSRPAGAGRPQSGPGKRRASSKSSVRSSGGESGGVRRQPVQGQPLSERFGELLGGAKHFRPGDRGTGRFGARVL